MPKIWMMQNLANIYYISTSAPLLWAVLADVQNGPGLYCIKCYFLLAEARKKQKMFSHTRLGARLWIGCNQVVQVKWAHVVWRMAAASPSSVWEVHFSNSLNDYTFLFFFSLHQWCFTNAWEFWNSNCKWKWSEWWRKYSCHATSR